MSDDKNIVLLCRHCATKNRIDKKRALYETQSIKCGKCKKKIFLDIDERLDFVNFDKFIHPLDASTMATIKKIPAINSILKFLVKHTKEKFFKVMLYQNYIKVSEKQFPEIYKLYKQMLFVLKFDYEPELFVFKNPYINAFTYGVDKHFIGITTAAIEELTDLELMDVLAHELGHIKLDHVLYKMSAEVIAKLSVMLGQKTLGIGSALIAPIHYALLAWSRASELSADRVAVMATKNLKAAHTTTLKLASGIAGWDSSKYNYEAFLEQGKIAKEIEDESILTKIYNLFENASITHPFPVWRAGELDDWAINGNFLNVISKNYVTETRVSTNMKDCPNCGNTFTAKLNVCPYCGHTDQEDRSFFDKLKDLFG